MAWLALSLPPPPPMLQLPGGCSNEPGPRGPSDQRPHVGRVGSGPPQAVQLPAARPPQPALQESPAPPHDAAGPCEPLAPRLCRGGASEGAVIRCLSGSFWFLRRKEKKIKLGSFVTF